MIAQDIIGICRSLAYQIAQHAEDSDTSVKDYMKAAGLDAWYGYFEKHLPANVETIQGVRATTGADLQRMARQANMRLDAKTTQQVLAALKKEPKAGTLLCGLTEEEAQTVQTDAAAAAEKLVIRQLRAFAASGRRVVLLVDALDEAQERGMNPVVKLLQDLAKAKTDALSVIVTM